MTNCTWLYNKCRHNDPNENYLKKCRVKPMEWLDVLLVIDKWLKLQLAFVTWPCIVQAHNPSPNTFLPTHQFKLYKSKILVATPLWGKCEDETHTPKSGNLESSGTPANSELDSRGQNTSPWGVIYIVGKALKCRCLKWPRMSHLDICSTSYRRKKGHESNW
jgi:hypothetical protein